ncbi:MAG: hypothetical protein PHU23_08835 [Dehalococcoidales bacterium]|nr:hypothetical protein [Dehalococcoidales bacterium]
MARKNKLSREEFKRLVEKALVTLPEEFQCYLDNLAVVIEDEPPDVTKISKEALAKAVNIFDDIKHRELRPVNEIQQDIARAEIDTRLGIVVLGCTPELMAPDGPLALLRQKLALEPSITGSKVS